ncbi:hypothetical protein [Streptomyces sp. NPDC007991]|uniref:hypothetical protein n=1 Tax=Streptomyces sp. NPDC007991 TaxID=3364803 RepID=UPI0036F0B73C
MAGRPLLAVLERPVQTGQVETSYADLLYVVRELHRQFGGVRLLLRGAAVTAAVDGTRHGPPPLGPALRALAPSPAEGLAALLADGVTVRADLASLTRLGLAQRRLVSGVLACDAGRLAEELPAYERVWFL